MALTVRDALDALLLDVGELGDRTARTLALTLLNDALTSVWQAHAWLDYRSPAPLLLTLTPGASRYALPSHVGRVLGAITNRSRPGAPIPPIDATEAATRYPAMSTETAPVGPTEAFRLAGITGVSLQPLPLGEALELVSDAAGDTAVQVTVRGDDAQGVARTRRVTLMGATPVAVGTWTYVDETSKAYLDTVAGTPGQSSAGTVTLRVAAAPARVLVALDPTESAREHKVLQVFPTPHTADILALSIVRRPSPLVAPSDALPGDWWPAIKEAWLIAYRINTGELGVDAQVPRPCLRKLIEDDNLLQPRPQRRPYGGRW